MAATLWRKAEFDTVRPVKNDFVISDALYLRSKSPCAAHGPLMNMVPGRQHYSCGQAHGQFYGCQSFGL